MSEVTGRIRIIDVPDGEAPLDVRKAWVGLILPCYPHVGFSPRAREEYEVLSGKKAKNTYHANVPQDQAILVLDNTKPEASKWWRENGFPRADENFSFEDKCFEAVSGVTYRQIVHVTDEMQGDPFR